LPGRSDGMRGRKTVHTPDDPVVLLPGYAQAKVAIPK
jgi:hypothetical protein